MVIRFHNVGRQKRQWEFTVPNVKYTQRIFRGNYGEYLENVILQSIKQSNALASREISISISQGVHKAAGTIFAGGRTVGSYEVLNDDKVA